MPTDQLNFALVASYSDSWRGLTSALEAHPEPDLERVDRGVDVAIMFDPTGQTHPLPY